MMDMYEAFGWEVTDVSPSMVDHVVISFKRNRKQKHKVGITGLQPRGNGCKQRSKANIRLSKM